MPVIDGRTWLEHLPAKRCWELLASVPTGRLGVVVDGAPEIYPLNHAVDGRSIVFRLDPGTKLRGLLTDPRVCYEADAFEEDGSVWSVLVKGHAEEIQDTAERRAARELPLELWAPGPKTRWIRLRPIEVTGRQVRPPSSAETKEGR
jgi:nitroimidazol reductase NimA-like FMN-containing flavoprotein (pyridoxamine 5'-phosphate oxidase superfamily)